MTEDPGAARQQIGRLLRECREGFGRRLDHVAQETQVRQVYLRALEEGDYRAFPGEFWAQQFLRNYAQYLGLPPEELIMRAFPEAAGQGGRAAPAVHPAGLPSRRRRGRPTAALGRVQSSVPGRRARRRWVPYVVAPILALLVAAVIVVVVVVLTHAPPSLPRLPSHLPGTGAPAAGRAGGAPAAAGRGGVAARPPRRAATVTAAELNVVRQSAASGTYVYSVRPGPLRVTVVVSAPCWVAASADGRRVAYATEPAGRTLTFTAVRQFSAVLGDPAGARLRVNGITLPAWQGARPVTVTVDAAAA